MDKILDGNDFARLQGFSDLRDFLRKKKYAGYDTPYQDVAPEGKPVTAFVSFGFWIAQCECNGAEYVAEGQPFYCHSCGNADNGGKPRLVIFPHDKAQIEKLLLSRPVINGNGRNIFERVQRQRALVQTEYGWLTRTWLPSETTKDLAAQNKELPSRKRK
jgi:hypothetical protein